MTGFDGQGPFIDGTGVPGAIVTSSVVSAVGGAAISGGTCTTGTDANGQCTITVTNPGSGSIVVQLEQASFTIDGQAFVIDLTPGARGLRADAVLPIRSDKVWWQYRVVLSDSSVNPLGVNHTFTATVQRTEGRRHDMVAGARRRASPALCRTDPHNVSQVDTGHSTCPTTGAGTADGTCTFVVTSTGPTTGTLTDSRNPGHVPRPQPQRSERRTHRSDP